jgi:hypothetical protein
VVRNTKNLIILFTVFILWTLFFQHQKLLEKRRRRETVVVVFFSCDIKTKSSTEKKRKEDDDDEEGFSGPTQMCHTALRLGHRGRSKRGGTTGFVKQRRTDCERETARGDVDGNAFERLERD